ncbi:MAG: glycosyltransferase family 4 protein [Pseudomonadota bacterium]
MLNVISDYLKRRETRARRRKVRETVAAELDAEFYRSRYPDIVANDVDPVAHYVRAGAREGRDPTAEFSTKFYAEANADVRKSGVNPFYHYITHGRAEGRPPREMHPANPDFMKLCKALGAAPEEMRQRFEAERADIAGRLAGGALGRMVEKAAALEPLIHHPSRKGAEPTIPPFNPRHQKGFAAIGALQAAVGHRRFRNVVALPHVRMSGAARVAGELASALGEIDAPEEILILRTDLSDYQHPEWFPAQATTLDFSAEVAGLSGPERQRLLFSFIRSLGPERVFNCNSRLFWDMFAAYGRAMSASTSVYAYMFCSDQNAEGHEAGYPVEFFSRCFDDLTGLITDSVSLKETLAARFAPPPRQRAKIVSLPTPLADAADPVAAPISSERPCVFWAGRFDRQKRVDVVFDLARRMPDVDFRLWGKPVLDGPLRDGAAPENCLLEGVYADFSDLPMNECDAWLYTAAWDGVPTILLDVAATATPLVGTVVGGTGEVLREGLSGRIDDVGDLDGYEAALRAVFADSAGARARAVELRALILEERARSRYRSLLETHLAETRS